MWVHLWGNIIYNQLMVVLFVVVHILKKKLQKKGNYHINCWEDKNATSLLLFLPLVFFFYWLFRRKSSPIDTHTLMSIFANYEYRWTKLPFYQGRQPTSQRDSTHRPHFNFKKCSYAILLEVNSLFWRFS